MLCYFYESRNITELIARIILTKILLTIGMLAKDGTKFGNRSIFVIIFFCRWIHNMSALTHPALVLNSSVNIVIYCFVGTR